MKFLVPFLISMALPLVAAEPPPVLALGATAPDFSLPGIDGKTHTLSEFSAAKVLVVIFTSNHCPEANAAAPRMAELDARYRSKSVAFVAISGNHPDALRPDELGYSPYGDSVGEMKPFADENGWKFPYLYDGKTQSVTTAYGAQATPHVFVFDADRKLRYRGRMDDAKREFGPVDRSYVADAIDAVLSGGTVDPDSTRPFGCSTKWLWKRESVKADQKRWESLPVTLEKLDAGKAKALRRNGTGKLRIINFWATSCGPCVAEFPSLVETYRRFQNRPVELVTVSFDPPAEEAKVLRFLKSRHAALSPRTADSLAAEGRATNNYIATGNPDDIADAIDKDWAGALPLTVVVAPEGEVIWRSDDEVDVFKLRSALVNWLRSNGF